MTIGLVDYGMGNQRSVHNALLAAGANVRVIRAAGDLAGVRGVVLPGVGAFPAGMEKVRALDLVSALRRLVVDDDVPFLGICLGMQLLADLGREFGDTQGLGWIPGTVRKLDAPAGLRLPHIGWNEVAGVGPLFAGLPERSAFYFVHSFCFDVEDPSTIVGRTEYGESFTSAVQSRRVFGVQFHPEKSHTHGIALLRNFVSLSNA